jgi:hypothetical protein
MRDSPGTEASSIRHLRGGLVAFVALVLALACGRAVDQPEAGSNSNWLKKCVATPECGGDLACLCGVCTKGCASSAECAASECLALPSSCADALVIGQACGVPVASPPPVVDEQPVNSDAGAPFVERGEEPGEEFPCLDDLWLDAIVVELRTPGDVWAPGEYVLTLTSGDSTRTCDFAFGPAADAGAGGELLRQMTCTPGLIQDGNEYPSGRVDRGLSPIELCEQPCEQSYARSYLGVLVTPGPGSPTDLRLTLTRDAVGLLDTTQPIEITESEPNGSGCGIVRRGELTLTLEE